MANIELDGTNKKIKVDSGDLTLDVPGDIILDADGADLVFADGGTNILKVTNSSSDVVLQPQVDAKDIIFKQYDGTTVATVEDNGTFNVPTSKLAINGTAITSTAAELNILDGVTATAAEINLIDGGTARGTTAIADGDGVLINDAGTMRMTSVETLATYIGGGVTATSQWRLTTTFSNAADPITSNWEECDTTGYSNLGSAMSESSGIFTFPSTGYWLIIYSASFNNSSADERYVNALINTTTDNSSYVDSAKAFSNVPQGNNGTSTGANATCSFLFDVTNTTTHKASFTTEVTVSSTQTTGDDGVNNTHVTFMRLGDT